MAPRRNSNPQQWTTAELWDALRASLADAATRITDSATYIGILHDRGEDVSELPAALLQRLLAIRDGKLLAANFIRYSHRTELLDAVSALVPEDQAKVAESGARVPVLQSDGKTRDVPVIALARRQVTQVFGDGRIRTPAEQRRFLAPAPAPRVDLSDAERRNGFLFDLLGCTPGQRADLIALAKKRGVTVEVVIMRCLVAHKVCRPTPEKHDKAA